MAVPGQYEITPPINLRLLDLELMNRVGEDVLRETSGWLGAEIRAEGVGPAETV